MAGPFRCRASAPVKEVVVEGAGEGATAASSDGPTPALGRKEAQRRIGAAAVPSEKVGQLQ